jgi:hypothetical protein
VLCRALNALVDWGAFGTSMRRFKTEGDSSQGYSRELYEIILVDVFGAQFSKGGQWYKRCNAALVLSQLLQVRLRPRPVSPYRRLRIQGGQGVIQVHCISGSLLVNYKID